LEVVGFVLLKEGRQGSGCPRFTSVNVANFGVVKRDC